MQIHERFGVYDMCILCLALKIPVQTNMAQSRAEPRVLRLPVGLVSRYSSHSFRPVAPSSAANTAKKKNNLQSGRSRLEDFLGASMNLTGIFQACDESGDGVLTEDELRLGVQDTGYRRIVQA